LVPATPDVTLVPQHVKPLLLVLKGLKGMVEVASAAVLFGTVVVEIQVLVLLSHSDPSLVLIQPI